MLPAVPPVAAWLVPPIAVPPDVVPPVPRLLALPPEPPRPASVPAAKVPPLLAASEAASGRPARGDVRSTHAVERKTATSAGKTGKQERVTFIIPVSDILRKCGGSRVQMQLSRDCPGIWSKRPLACRGDLRPEQVSNFGGVTHLADLYALGCIAYQMFTGAVPFDADEIMPILMAHMSRAPEPPRQRNPAIPAELEAVILRLLAKRPEDRVQSCRELAEILLRLRLAGA